MIYPTKSGIQPTNRSLQYIISTTPDITTTLDMYCKTEFQTRVLDAIKVLYPNKTNYLYKRIIKEYDILNLNSLIDSHIDICDDVCLSHHTKKLRASYFKEASKYAYPKNMFIDIYFGGTGFNYTALRGEKMLEIMKTRIDRREAYILECRYKNYMTMEDIALSMGITRGHVGQIMHRAQRKMCHSSRIMPILEAHNIEHIDVNNDNIDDVDNVDIEELNISNNGYMKLINFGIYKLKTIRQFTRVELNKYVGLDETDVDIIVKYLDSKGSSLMEYPEYKIETEKDVIV